VAAGNLILLLQFVYGESALQASVNNNKKYPLWCSELQKKIRPAARSFWPRLRSKLSLVNFYCVEKQAYAICNKYDN
jgi:hypothetical protein